MGNSDIISPHEFKHPSRWYYRVQEVAKHTFGVGTYGITSIPSFIKILTRIVQLSNAQKRMTQVKFKFGWVGLGLVRFVMRMRSGP
jgi:hypothetical protein